MGGVIRHHPLQSLVFLAESFGAVTALLDAQIIARRDLETIPLSPRN